MIAATVPSDVRLRTPDSGSGVRVYLEPIARTNKLNRSTPSRIPAVAHGCRSSSHGDHS